MLTASKWILLHLGHVLEVHGLPKLECSRHAPLLSRSQTETIWGLVLLFLRWKWYLWTMLPQTLSLGISPAERHLHFFLRQTQRTTQSSTQLLGTSSPSWLQELPAQKRNGLWISTTRKNIELIQINEPQTIMVPHPFPCLPIGHSMRLDAEWPGGFVSKRHQDGITNFSFYHRTYTNSGESLSTTEQIPGQPGEPSKAGPPFIQGRWEQIRNRGGWRMSLSLCSSPCGHCLSDLDFLCFSPVYFSKKKYPQLLWSHTQDYPQSLVSLWLLLVITTLILFPQVCVLFHVLFPPVASPSIAIINFCCH